MPSSKAGGLTPKSGLEQWLQNPILAEWAKSWIQELEQQHGSDLPKLLSEGLGGSWNVPSWMQHDRPIPYWLKRMLGDGSMRKEWFELGYFRDDPPWLEELIQKESAQVARSFLVCGNITDYTFDPVYGYRPSINVLLDQLARIKDCVFHFRLSHGLRLHHRNGAKASEKLDSEIQNLLQTPFPRKDASLESDIRMLFSALHHWLTGQRMTNQDARSSVEFSRGVALVFENVNLLIPLHGENLDRNFLVDTLLHWSISPEMFRQKHCLILMAETLDDVSVELRARGGKIEQVNIPRPSSPEERLKFILPTLNPHSEMHETRASNLCHGLRLNGYTGDFRQQVRQLANDTAGLTFLGIEDLLQRASVQGHSLSRDAVMALKRDRLKQESEGLLEVIDPRVGLESIGGYKEIKNRIQEIIDSLRNAADERVRSTVPMGILFLGPPGTGKSMMAEAIAGASHVSMAKLGNIRGMYVGQSERNLSRVFSLIEALYPVIVFIDEFDQAIGKRDSSGDSGVENRLFGKFLEFMSNKEHRGRILWIGAANRPNQIDSALKRPGRFDLVLPFLLPNQESRAQILRVSLEKILKRPKDLDAQIPLHRLSEADFVALAKQTERFSGAELSAIIEETHRRSFRLGGDEGQFKPIELEDIAKVLALYRSPPDQRSDYENMERMAIQALRFSDLIPAERRNGQNPLLS